MKTSINKEYAARHLFACLTMAGLFAWFAYDGFVKYPATPAEELYAQIEKSAPPESMSKEALETFKSQKTKSQISFAAVCLLLSAVVGLRLFSASRFSLEFDDDGFSVGVATDSTGENLDRLMAIVESLPSMQQTILRLRHIEGMEMSDIAEMTGSNEVALRKVLSRARQAVRLQFLKQNNP